ncbi:MAG: nucleotidyltransferase family protein [Burkholderiales bacterium]|nr:nucleotidyltransferase family protein [Burkholderiales bacterium]
MTTGATTRASRGASRSDAAERAAASLPHAGGSAARPLLCTIWSAPAPPTLTGAQWEQFIAHARRSRLIARLAEHFRAQGWLDAVPLGPATALRNALKEARRQHDETVWEVARLRDALLRIPGPIVLLKGAAYVLAGLPPHRGRLFGDIDLMVDRADLRDAEGALFAAGWIATRLDPYDERYYRDWMHELPPMEHVERRTHIDVHHTITPPTSRYAVDSALLLRELAPLAGQPRLFVLCPADMVLHSASHLLQEGDFGAGLRDLLDFRDLLEHFGRDPAFWPALAARARQLGLSGPLDYMCRLSQSLLDAAPLPESFRTELLKQAPPGPGRRLTLRLLSIVLVGGGPAGPALGEPLARWLLYVRSHWIRMPWYRILPHLARKAWFRARSRWAVAEPPTAEGQG